MNSVRLPVSLVVMMGLTLGTSSMARAQESTGVYSVNQAASVVGFTIVGSMIFKIKRDGQFKDFAGELSYDPANPAGTRVDLTVYTASVDMRNAEHDQLMKSEEFFDVQRFPTMHFTSASTEIKPDGTLSMTGDMTIRGVTKRMAIPVKVRDGVFDTTFPIDRTEFGLNGSPSIGGFKLSISKNVTIHIAIATAPHRIS